MRKISRARRAEMQRQAQRIRRTGQRNQHSVERIAAEISEIPGMLPLEAWRLAFGWSRPQALAGIAALYEADELAAPPITSSMLCRWEHGATTPDDEYAGYLSRLYQAGPAQIGLKRGVAPKTPNGLAFPRELPAAIHTATTWWACGESSETFTAGASTTPMARWLTQPADTDVGRTSARRRVGARDIAELHEAAEQARHYDSKYGGGSAGAGMVIACLRDRATPLLNGTYTDAVGRTLFSATAQLARLAGYSAWDTGRHDRAQRHYIQALRLARAAGDIPLGGYVLASMSLQAALLDHHDEAIDTAQAAYERAKQTATPRTLAFFKLVEARAHARAGDRRSAGLTLAHSAKLLNKAEPSDDDPHWIDFFTHARLAADAAEVHRDLAMPHQVIQFEEQATMPQDTFARSYGMRSAIVASAHLQARRLDEALHFGHRAVNVMSHIASARSLDYLKDLGKQLDPWAGEPSVIDFRHRAHQVLTLAP